MKRWAGYGMLVCWICLVSGYGSLMANNLRIWNLVSDESHLEATIAWNNSWNLSSGIGNHDAVWLFAKVKKGNGEWNHLRLSSAVGAHSTDNEAELKMNPVSDGTGVMLRNNGSGSGNIAPTRISLSFESALGSGVYEVQLLGIEMAWVSTGPFWVGDGVSNFALHDSSNGQPYFLVGESEISKGVLGAEAGKFPRAEIPAAFPKGFEGYYLMKYEISQAQYVDFLNTLSLQQQRARTASAPEGPEGSLALAGNNANRNAIVIAAKSTSSSQPAKYGCNLDGGGTDGDFDGQDRACNWLTWGDLAAYLDWAALRPVTELEYEKACRGPQVPVAGEFAWGTDSIVDANTVQEDGSEDEHVAEAATLGAGLGSHGYDGPQGPLRCGFAANGESGRLQAGAGYYGHMELSGNLWELCVSVSGNGLQFDGAYGDGRLGDDGAADVANWPDAGGVGFRGGGWNSGIIPGFRDLAVSDRFYIDWYPDTRRNTTGGRGAR